MSDTVISGGFTADRSLWFDFVIAAP